MSRERREREGEQRSGPPRAAKWFHSFDLNSKCSRFFLSSHGKCIPGTGKDYQQECDARMNLRLLVSAIIYLLIAGCASPGTDRQGRNLLATGDRIVAALEEFRLARGGYPLALAQLPELFDLGEQDSDHEFRYRQQGESFQLSLRYTRPWPSPGWVSCAFDHSGRAWTCDRYFQPRHLI
jgi:hypothetical protein